METSLQLRSLVKSSGELELSLARVPVPQPAADEVLVRIEGAPINPSDLGLLLGPVDVSAAKAFLSGNFVKYKGQNQKAAAEKERSAKVSCQASKCSSRERACFFRSEIGAGKTAGKPKLNKRKGHGINHQCSSKKPVGDRVGLQIYQRQHEKNADKRNCAQQLPAYAVTENAAKP